MAFLVCINGSPRRASRTGVLAGCLAAAIEARVSSRRADIAFADVGLAVVSGLDRASLSPAGEEICRMVEAAHVLIVASPVYRASYPGPMEHLFDLVDRDAMRGKIAVLAATGGTPLQGLVLEHQMRPLMGFSPSARRRRRSTGSSTRSDSTAGSRRTSPTASRTPRTRWRRCSIGRRIPSERPPE